jgi:hypothetical protein
VSYFPSASEDATRRTLAHLYQGYSPECVEVEFCELRPNGVLRRWDEKADPPYAVPLAGLQMLYGL